MEYLAYKNFVLKKNYTTKNKATIKKHLTNYIENGGFPEIIHSNSKTELTQLYRDIIINDLMIRFDIKATHSFRELALYLVSNITSYISYNNLAKTPPPGDPAPISGVMMIPVEPFVSATTAVVIE